MKMRQKKVTADVIAETRRGSIAMQLEGDWLPVGGLDRDIVVQVRTDVDRKLIAYELLELADRIARP